MGAEVVEGVAGETPAGPVVLRLRTERGVEALRRFVPVEDGPVDPAVSLRDRYPRQLLQQRDRNRRRARPG